MYVYRERKEGGKKGEKEGGRERKRDREGMRVEATLYIFSHPFFLVRIYPEYFLVLYEFQ